MLIVLFYCVFYIIAATLFHQQKEVWQNPAAIMTDKCRLVAVGNILLLDSEGKIRIFDGIQSSVATNNYDKQKVDTFLSQHTPGSTCQGHLCNP